MSKSCPPGNYFYVATAKLGLAWSILGQETFTRKRIVVRYIFGWPIQCTATFYLPNITINEYKSPIAVL